MDNEIPLDSSKESTWRLWLLMAVWVLLFALLGVADYRPDWLPLSGDPILLVFAVSVFSMLMISVLFVAGRLQTTLVLDASIAADFPQETRDFLDAMTHLLGFEGDGPTVKARRGRNCIMRPHSSDPSWACVVLHERLVLALDLFTEFDGQRTLVTSSSKPSGLPVPRGYRAQFLGATSPNELIEAHREAVELLLANGWHPKTVPDDQLFAALVRHYDRVLGAFLRQPLRATITMLWRGLTMRHPQARLLTEQERDGSQKDNPTDVEP